MSVPTNQYTYTRSGYQSLKGITDDPINSSYNIPSSAIQVIPVYKSFGYNALNHGETNSDGTYFRYDPAYPSFPSDCGVIRLRLCDSANLAFPQRPTPN